MRYLREATAASFLELPDVLGASPVLFRMLSYLGAFPFSDENAPVLLGLEQLVIIVVLLTDRYLRALPLPAATTKTRVERRSRLLFKSLAVYDRHAAGLEPGGTTAVVGDDATPAGDGGEDDGEDELVRAALTLLDVVSTTSERNDPSVHASMIIPGDNFRRLVQLLLLIAPLGAQERLSQYSTQLLEGSVLAGEDGGLAALRRTAGHVCAAFLDVEQSPGIGFGRFDAVLQTSFPYLFEGLSPLFEHFLFSENLDFSRHKVDSADSGPSGATATPATPSTTVPTIQPLLPEQGEILTLPMLSQLSFFLPGSDLFRRLRPLYSGSEAGFSLGSFQSKVFNWRAPTILLVRGTRIRRGRRPRSGPEAAFMASLPPKRFPDSSGRGSSGRSGALDGHDHADDDDSDDDDETLVFGAFIAQPWKMTPAGGECFGDERTILFQLVPVHDVFRASTVNRNYASFSRPPTPRPGIAFGCTPPPRRHHAAGNSGGGDLRRRDSSGSSDPAGLALSPGPVSLIIDGSFEFGVFHHDFSTFPGGGGGAFRASASRRFDFQDRFSVDALEVWGCGGDAEAQAQAERWAWERREAEARRRINLGTGDIDADRALLEMAGLIGQGRSGGSMT